MAVKLLDDRKKKDIKYLYVKDAIAYYASVQEPKFKYQSKTEKEYSITLFVSEEDKDKMEDEYNLNKEFVKAWTGKNKKKKVKYPKETYPDVEGMYGVTFTQNEKTRAGKQNVITVIDKDGEALPDLIGNGSTVTVKCFGYYNDDELLIAKLNLVLVQDLVEYTGGSGVVEDDELGISYEIGANKKVDEEESNSELDDIPFDVSDDSSEDY